MVANACSSKREAAARGDLRSVSVVSAAGLDIVGLVGRQTGLFALTLEDARGAIDWCGTANSKPTA